MPIPKMMSDNTRLTTALFRKSHISASLYTQTNSFDTRYDTI